MIKVSGLTVLGLGSTVEGAGMVVGPGDMLGSVITARIWLLFGIASFCVISTKAPFHLSSFICKFNYL